MHLLFGVMLSLCLKTDVRSPGVSYGNCYPSGIIVVKCLKTTIECFRLIADLELEQDGGCQTLM